MIARIGTSPSWAWARPLAAAPPRSDSPDSVELSHAEPPPRPWYRRLWESVFGAAEQVAVEPAGLPAQIAVMAQQEPPEDYSLQGPLAELGGKLIEAARDNGSKRALHAELRQCQEVPPEQAALRALSKLTYYRADVGRTALEHLQIDRPLRMLDVCADKENKARLAQAGLTGKQDPLELLGAVTGTDKGRVAPIALEHSPFMIAFLECSGDNNIRGQLAEAMLRAEPTPERIAQAALNSQPSDYTTTRGRLAEIAVRSIPSQGLTRVAVEAAGDNGCKASLALTGLQGVQEQQVPGQLALDLLEAIPGDYTTTRRSVAVALAGPLTRDPQVGAAACLFEAMATGIGDDACKANAFRAIIGAGLQQKKAGETALVGLASIPSDYTTTRAGASRAALAALESDPEVGGYCQLGNRLLASVGDNGVASNLAISVLASGLAKRSLVETAEAAMATVPSTYTTSRGSLAVAIMAELADSPESSLARVMVDAAGDNGCKTSITLAALRAIGSGEEAPLSATAKRLWETIPSDYTTTRGNVGRAMLQELRSFYSDPEASSLIDAGGDIVQILQKLTTMKTARQQVEELAAAVTGKAGVGGVEEREKVVVIGGVRVKVKR